MELQKFMDVKLAGDEIGWWKSYEEQTGLATTVQDVEETVKYIEKTYVNRWTSWNRAVKQWKEETERDFI